MKKNSVAGWVVASLMLASSCFPVGALESQQVQLPSGWDEATVEVGVLSEGLMPFQSQLGAGYFNTSGAIVIQPIYATALPFVDGYGQVTTKDGKTLWVDVHGTEYEQKPAATTSSMWMQALTQDNGLYLTNQGDDSFLLGYQNDKGEVVIPCKYQKAGAFYQGVAPVTEDGVNWYAIDTQGNKVRDISYAGLDDAIGGGLLTYRIGDLTGLVNDQGRVVIPVGQYQEYVYLGQGIFKAREREFDSASPCHLYRVNGTRVISEGYADFGTYSEGLAAVYDFEGNLGFVDTKGQMQVPMEYLSPVQQGDDQQDVLFHEGYVCVKDAQGFVLLQNPLTETQTQVPQQPQTETKPTGVTATRTNASVQVDGKAQAFDVYNIAGSNYFKLRDIAYVLNGTGSQFSVGFDAQSNSIALKKGQAYEAAGGEMTPGEGTGNVQAQPSSQKVLVEGNAVSLEVYNIGGSNYFKLRDLGDALNFRVEWNQDSQTVEIFSVKAPDETDPTDETQTGEETPQQAVLRLVNEERKKAGLPAMTTTSQLQQAADIRAKEMNQLVSHNRPDGSSCFTVLDEVGIEYAVAGENIASGVSSAEAVMQAWMQSEGHRANILNKDFTQIGIGNDGVHWVQIFIS